MRDGERMSMKKLLKAIENAERGLPSENFFRRMLDKLVKKEMLGFLRSFVRE